MTDEALIEKMAREMCAQGDSYLWDNLIPEDREAYLNQARAALSVVRDHEKMVQAGSTGAVRSTEPSAADVDAWLDAAVSGLGLIKVMADELEAVVECVRGLTAPADASVKLEVAR